MALTAVVEAARFLDFFKPLVACDRDTIEVDTGPEGFASTLIDASGSVAVRTRLRREGFVHVEGEPLRLTIPTSRFDKLLRSMPRSGPVRMTSGDGDTVTINVGTRFILRNAFSEHVERTLPEFEFQAVLKVPMAPFVGYLKTLETQGIEAVSVSYDPAVGFSCTGSDELSDVEWECPVHQLGLTPKNAAVGVSRYTPAVLASFLGLDTFNGDHMTVGLQEDRPIRMDAPFAEGHGELAVIVAPLARRPGAD